MEQNSIATMGPSIHRFHLFLSPSLSPSLTGVRNDNIEAARVLVDKRRHVKHLAAHGDPARLLGRVLAHLVERDDASVAAV